MYFLNNKLYWNTYIRTHKLYKLEDLVFEWYLVVAVICPECFRDHKSLQNQILAFFDDV